MLKRIKQSLALLMATLIFIPTIMAANVVDNQIVGNWHWDSDNSDVTRSMTIDIHKDHSFIIDATLTRKTGTGSNKEHAVGTWSLQNDGIILQYSSVSFSLPDPDIHFVFDITNPDFATIKSVNASTLVLIFSKEVTFTRQG